MQKLKQVNATLEFLGFHSDPEIVSSGAGQFAITLSAAALPNAPPALA